MRELAGFVRELAELGGYVTSAELARDAGFPATNLSDVRNAKAGIEGYNLLRLIRAVARRLDRALGDVATTAARGAELDTSESRAEVAARLEELDKMAQTLHGLLREGASAAFADYVNSRVAAAQQQPQERQQAIREFRQVGERLAAIADELDHTEESPAEQREAGDATS